MIEGYTQRMKDAGKKPIYSIRSIIKGISDPRYEKLRAELKNSNRKRHIKVYATQIEDVKSNAELKREYQSLVDYANYANDMHSHTLTSTLISMADPNSRYLHDNDRKWPFYTMCNDIDWDKEYVTNIIVVKKEDSNY